MTRSLSALVAFSLSLAVAAALNAQARTGGIEGESRVVNMARVPGVTKGNAFLGWDDKSRLFLLDANTFDVYPVSPSGLGDPEHLGLRDDLPPLVPSAAMGDSEDEWLVHAGQNRILRFESGKQAAIVQPEWFVTSVAYFDGQPAAFVLPARMGQNLELTKESPWLVVRDSTSWAVEISAEMDEQVAAEVLGAESPMDIMRGHFAASTSPARSGGLWVADSYQHRLRRLSRAGEVEDTITVGETRVEFVDFAEAEVKDFRDAAKANGIDVPRHIIEAGRLKGAVEAIAEARDGRLYVLVSPDALEGDRPEPRGDLALERFDPILLTYQRIELAFPAEAGGRWDMAPSRDGLYLLSFAGGLWFASWEALEAAEWTDVEGAQLDGQPLALPG